MRSELDTHGRRKSVHRLPVCTRDSKGLGSAWFFSKDRTREWARTKEVMTPPTMTLEETKQELETLISGNQYSLHQVEIHALQSALHHLEAGRKVVADANFSNRTLKILNDITEDIDCRESRGVLRKTIAEMADKWMHLTEQEHLKRMDAQTDAMLKLSKKMEEVQRKVCECAELKRHIENGYAGEGLVGDPGETCVYFVDTFDDTPILPPISFCPWCGGTISPQPSQQEGQG